MFAINNQPIKQKLLRVKSQLLMARVKLLRFLKKSSLAAFLLSIARALKIPLLAGERNVGSAIDLKKVAKTGNKKHIVVVFPNLFWNFRWQRPQQLFSHCAKDGYTVLFISLKTKGIHIELRDIYEAGDYLVLQEHATNVIDCKLPSVTEKFVLNDSFTTESINSMILALSALIFDIAEQWKQQTPKVTYIVEHPNWQPLVKQIREQIKGKVILDLMDNHRGFDQVSKTATRMEIKLLKSADSTVVSSLYLKNYAKTYTKELCIIRNATDYHHFENETRNGLLDPLLGKPIIGYFGALNEWFDMELVAVTAKAHPEWNFVLIGSLSPCNFTPVEHLKNVLFLGEKAYSALPGYLSYFDVCIIPFKLNPLTLATNPVKFYEYLSMGKAVVSTPLPELIPYTDYCYLANDESEFAKKIQLALTTNASHTATKLANKRKKLAKRNTWKKRWLKLKGLFN